MSRFPELDLSDVATYKASERLSKVSTAFEGTPPYKDMTIKSFLEGLPKILKANDLKLLAKAVAVAKQKKRPVIAMFGGLTYPNPVMICNSRVPNTLKYPLCSSAYLNTPFGMN